MTIRLEDVPLCPNCGAELDPSAVDWWLNVAVCSFCNEHDYDRLPAVLAIMATRALRDYVVTRGPWVFYVNDWHRDARCTCFDIFNRYADRHPADCSYPDLTGLDLHNPGFSLFMPAEMRRQIAAGLDEQTARADSIAGVFTRLT